MGVLHFIAIIADSKSRHKLFFYPIKERVKRTGNTFQYIFLSSGGRLWKGKVLASFSFVVIHGLLVASSLWKNCFAWNVFVIGFECIFEKCLCLGKLCNDSPLYNNVYKVLTFENISLKVLVFERYLFWNVCEQATTRILPTQKKYFFFSSSLR